jgi:hypothetical protein
MPVNRALKAAQVPCALFAALEAKAKHHHHPQLAQRRISPPPVPRSVPATSCQLVGLLLLLRFYCRLHELSNEQQEAGSRYISGWELGHPPPAPEGGGSPRSACCLLCFLPSAPQACPKRVLRPRGCAAGGKNLVADDELRGRERESRAKPELRLGTSPRSACSAFCLLRRRPAQNGCCAAGRENLVADDELRGRGRESRAKPELRPRTRSPPPSEGGGEGVASPRSACSAFCLQRRRPAQNGCCAAGRENLADDELRGEREREREQGQAGAKTGD